MVRNHYRPVLVSGVFCYTASLIKIVERLMDASIWQTIAETPWWLYVIAAYFIMICWVATRPSIVPVKSLLVLPCLFLLFSLPALILYSEFNMVNSLLAFLIGGVGVPFGWLEFKIHRIKAFKNEDKLYIPGTWNLFILIAIFCLLKFYFEFTLNDFLTLKIFTHHKLSTNLIFVYAFLLGFFIGRYGYARQCLKSGPFYSD